MLVEKLMSRALKCGLHRRFSLFHRHVNKEALASYHEDHEKAIKWRVLLVNVVAHKLGTFFVQTSQKVMGRALN